MAGCGVAPLGAQGFDLPACGKRTGFGARGNAVEVCGRRRNA